MPTTNENLNVAKRTSTSRVIVLIALATCAFAVTACNTTEGFGKDVKNLGGNIEKSAEKNK